MTKMFETIAEGGVIHLPPGVSSTARCVVTVLDGDANSLHQQANFELPDAIQRRMSELLEKSREGSLAAAERDELDRLAAEFDTATLAKGQALAALSQLRDK